MPPLSGLSRGRHDGRLAFEHDRVSHRARAIKYDAAPLRQDFPYGAPRSDGVADSHWRLETDVHSKKDRAGTWHLHSEHGGNVACSQDAVGDATLERRRSE